MVSNWQHHSNIPPMRMCLLSPWHGSEIRTVMLSAAGCESKDRRIHAAGLGVAMREVDRIDLGACEAPGRLLHDWGHTEAWLYAHGATPLTTTVIGHSLARWSKSAHLTVPKLLLYMVEAGLTQLGSGATGCRP